MDGTAGSGRELFISRAGEDKAAALGVEAILRAAGYATFLQDRDFGHVSFMARMAEGFAKAIDLNSLTLFLQDTNRLAEAEPLLRRVVEILDRFERDTGHRHPHYDAAIGNVEALLAQIGAAALGAAATSEGAPEPTGKPPAKRGFLARLLGGS